MNVIKQRYGQLLANSQVGEILFFAGYILYLGRGVWATTMFPLHGGISKLCLLLSVVLIGLKIILYNRFKVSELWFAGCLVIISIMVFLSSSYLNIFLWALLIFGSKDISFKKILEVYLLITGIIVFLAFVSSLLGVIVNLQYETETRGIRQAFGISYTTDFAAHIFFLILVFFYLKGNRLKWIHYIGTLCVAVFIYHFCNARLDTISIVLMVLLFYLGSIIEDVPTITRNSKYQWHHFWRHTGLVSMPILAGIAFLLTILYSSDNTILNLVNKLISGRLALGKRGLEEYGLTLWGQAIDMVGMGGSVQMPADYFFIDCSYIFIFLRYGLVTLGIVLTVYVASCVKNKHDLYFLYAVALLAINCVIAHHLLEVEYNPFALALFSHCVRTRCSGTVAGEQVECRTFLGLVT